MPPQQQRRVSNCSILVPSLPEKQHQAFSLSLFVSLYPSLSFFEQIHNITCTTQHVGTQGGARPAWFPCLPLPFRPSSPPSSVRSLSFKQNATSIRALGYCTHPFPRMGESGPAACSPLALTHSFGHTSMFQNSGIQLRLLSLNSPFGHLHRKTDRQTSLPMSSRMTCTSLERLLLLPSVPPHQHRCPFGTNNSPLARCSTKVTHYIDTCHRSPSLCLVMCAVKLVRQPLHYWRRRTGKCRMAN